MQYWTTSQPAIQGPAREVEGFFLATVQIKWADLKGNLRNCLGGGSFGQVYKAYYQRDEIAVKFISIEENPSVPSLRRTLLKFK